jgi:putative hydrolase of the HAD superfamily
LIDVASLGLGVDVEAWTERFVVLEERGRVWKDVVYRRLCEEFELGIDPAELLAGYEGGFAAHVQPYPGLRETLAGLRELGFRIGVVTNGRSVFQRRTIAALGIEDLLDSIVISEGVGFRKPEAEIFRLALQDLDCDAAISFFVGDDLVADVEGSRAVGMTGIWFNPAGGGSVRTLSEVLARVAE